MSEKKPQIALVNATFNAVNPITNYMTANAKDMKVVNYLDGFLMEKIRNEGGINPQTMERMLHMISTACADGADVVILTCTIFSLYIDAFQHVFPVPVISPDGAMHDAVSKMPGKTAIICTFDGTVDTTRNLYYSYCRKNGTPEVVDMYTVPDAFAAANAYNMPECNRIIREKAVELDEQYDQIILAQISMSGATEGLTMKHAKVFTSPASALETARSLIQK